MRVAAFALVGLLAIACQAAPSSAGGQSAPPSASTASSAASSAASAPVVVGVLEAETGAAASVAQQQLAGLQTVIDDANAKGGIGGAKIQLNVQDTQSSAPTALQDFQRLVADPKTMAVVGPILTPEALVVKPEAERVGVAELAPVITDSFGDPPIDWFFRAIPASSLQTKSMLQYVKKQGWTKIGLLYPQESLGQSGADLINSQAGELGLKIVAQQSYPANTVDPSVEIGKVQAAKPDVYFVWDGDSTPRLALTVKTMREHGITQEIGTPVAASDPAFVQQVGASNAEGVFFWTFSASGQATPGTQQFEKLWDASTYNPKHQAPTSFVLMGAEFGQVLVAALSDLAKQGKPATRSNVRDAIEGLHDLQTTLGTLNYSHTNHATPFANALVAIYKNGKQVIALSS